MTEGNINLKSGISMIENEGAMEKEKKNGNEQG